MGLKEMAQDCNTVCSVQVCRQHTESLVMVSYCSLDMVSS